MIISFYPGAGGNRYLRMLRGHEYSTPDKTYDDQIVDQPYLNRYLVGDGCQDQDIVLTHCMNESHIKSKFPDHKIFFIIGDLKKCLQREWILLGHDRYLQRITIDNLDRLEHYNAYKDASWPECLTLNDLDCLPTLILTEVNADFKKIQSSLSSPLNTLDDLKKSISLKIDSSYETIRWHTDYYQKYPLSFSAESTIIDLQNDTDDFSKMMRSELDSYQSDIFDEVWNKLNEK